jgi:RNA polymerase sigma-70 factor (ECF subfamily)
VLDEHELVSKMRRGDRRAFNEFFDTYVPRLTSFASRRSSLDSAAIEDVVQQTMINAMRNLDGFRGGSSLFTWLCKICRNLLVDARRHAARLPNITSIEDLSAERPLATVVELTDFRDPLDECEVDSTRGAVRRIVNRLPPHYARILEMRFGDELSGQEIATALNLSADAAESLLSRARQAFKLAWTEWIETKGMTTSPDSGGAS